MRKAMILVGTLSLISGSAMAAEAGWYVGANIGTTKVKDLSQAEEDAYVVDLVNSYGLSPVSGSSSIDDKDTAWSLVFGYKFSKYFALEAGYADLGKAKYNASGTVTDGESDFPAEFKGEFSAKGPQLAAVGILPLGERFDVHARLGMIFDKTKVEESWSGAGNSYSDSFSANSTDVFYGAGAGFNLTGRVALNLDYQIYKNVGDENETGESDVETLTAGVTFSF